MTKNYSAPAAACAARVLLALARTDKALSLNEVAREAGSSRSLAYRVMRELEHLDFVEEGPAGGFVFGSAIVEFAPAVQRFQEAHGFARVLRDLAVATQQTVNLGVLRDFDVVIVAKQDAPEVRISISYVGARVSANSSALGKALLARLDDDEVLSRISDPLPALTSKTTVDPEQLLGELAEVRRSGVAVDLEGAILGRFAVAMVVDVLGQTDPVAIAVTGSMDDFSDELVGSLRERLTTAAGRLKLLPGGWASGV